MKKILIISPTPTHPTTAGNRIRILTTVEFLKGLGFDVFFILVDKSKLNEEAMTHYWGNNWLQFVPSSYKNSLSYLQLLLLKIYHYTGRLVNIPNFKFNRFIDSYYPDGLDEFVAQHLNLYSYHAVIVEYAILSRVLSNFPKNTFKMIDTHDKFTNRYKTYLESGLYPDWYSLFKRSEAKGLKRADHILAIQEKEAEYFKKISKKDVTVFGHLAVFKPVRNVKSNSIIFVASDNIININALNTFLIDVFPDIVSILNDFKFIIAGKIGKTKNLSIPPSLLPHIEIIDEFKNAEEVYSKASVAINPVKTGTGLKIKLIEAVSYGLPIISFKDSNDVFSNKLDSPIRLVSSNEDFVKEILKVLQTDSDSIYEQCKNFISINNDSHTKELKNVLNSII